MPESPADLLCQAPPLPRTSVELVATLLELDPVTRASQLVWVGPSVQIVGGSVRVDHVRQRIPELVHVQPRPVFGQYETEL